MPYSLISVDAHAPSLLASAPASAHASRHAKLRTCRSPRRLPFPPLDERRYWLPARVATATPSGCIAWKYRLPDALSPNLEDRFRGDVLIHGFANAT